LLVFTKIKQTATRPCPLKPFTRP